MTASVPAQLAGGDIDGINHVGVVVRSMDAAAAAYERMGFMLTPLSMHAGSREPDGPIVDYGTGNRTIMFPHSYIEVLAVFDRSRYDYGFGAWLEHSEGGRILTFDCAAPDVVDARVAASGIKTSGVVSLQRDVDTPDGTRTARFSCVIFDDALTPEGLVQAAHHHTPEYIYQERYLAHPNGAGGVCDAFLCAEDAEAQVHKYTSLTGRPAVRNGALSVIQLPRGRVSIVAVDDAAETLPGGPAIATGTFLAGFGVEVANLDQVRAQLDEAGVDHIDHDGKVNVPAASAVGAMIVFERSF